MSSARFLAGGLAAVVAIGVLSARDAQDSRTTAAPRPADEDAIRATARDFVAAFNKGDARSIAGQWTEEGEYTVRLVDDWIPRVNISRTCMETFRDKNADPKTKEYLKRKIQSAQWLLESSFKYEFQWRTAFMG